MTGHPVRLLLIDDDPSVLRLMKTYLVRLGYDVEACLDGTTAWQTFEQASDRFQLLVADLTLPDISGEELAIKMAEQDPNLRVLLCSGYPLSNETLPAHLRDRVLTLQKPFSPNALAGELTKLLKDR